MKYASFKMWIADKYHYKEGYAIWLVVRKNNKRKVMALGIYAEPHQWNDKLEMFVTDKRVPKLHPDRIYLNEWLTQKKSEILRIIADFDSNKIDWTLNQFEQEFFHYSNKGNVKEFFENLIQTYKDTNHIGNANCYSRTLHVLELFDEKLSERVFPEIDIKYVKSFDVFLQKRECKGNTRKFYFKTLRAVLNKAIQDGEASETTYPFGKGGFSISSLEEETTKRYLPHDSMFKLKTTVMDNAVLERTRRLFLFSYYCYGISFIDAALLTKKNIIRYNGGNYIVYKRNKTKEAKKVKPIQIKITPEIQELMNWFSANTLLVEDYLLPIVSIAGYKGEQLYNHIRSRFGRNNKNLANLAKVLEITDVKLTSYVSRHTMAMTLQDNQVPREVISQILGHSDLATTNTYLDSFASSVIDEAVKVL
ncbi:site-specific integrase [Bacteroides gallinaceum]|uniref:site-specific integrase n=1 Tax=Bacteroides gallinaceum TaxID=1462571 RepID=UPI0025A429D0|nr:site-specific integrase [Bacteroides gallinaceum]MDM8207286.1 site-specific integrase [Bacteroides gallinaceum]